MNNYVKKLQRNHAYAHIKNGRLLHKMNGTGWRMARREIATFWIIAACFFTVVTPILAGFVEAPVLFAKDRK
jgi:hypothetical protein